MADRVDLDVLVYSMDGSKVPLDFSVLARVIFMRVYITFLCRSAHQTMLLLHSSLSIVSLSGF